jgi:hypothetical protein
VYTYYKYQALDVPERATVYSRALKYGLVAPGFADMESLSMLLTADSMLKEGIPRGLVLLNCDRTRPTLPEVETGSPAAGFDGSQVAWLYFPPNCKLRLVPFNDDWRAAFTVNPKTNATTLQLKPIYRPNAVSEKLAFTIRESRRSQKHAYLVCELRNPREAEQ